MLLKVRKIHNELSAELRLLLLCSSLKSNGKNQNAIDKLIASGINWTIFANLVLHHRVYTLVYWYLRTLVNPAVPNKVISTLYQLDQDNARRTLQMITEFMKILEIFRKNKIQAIVIKGFPLAQQLYGNITLRISKDLDILVSPKDIDGARKIIEMQGYIWNHPFAKTTAAHFKKWMEVNKHVEYWHPKLNVCIEIHWRLDCRGRDLPLNMIQNNTTSMKMFGQSINILGKEELLLYLVIHGAGHAWFRIKWLLDIDLIIRKGEFSWEKIYLLANNLGVKNILNQALFLLREILETPLPKAVTDLVEEDIQAQTLAIMALQFIKDNHFKTKSLKEKVILLYQKKVYEFNLNIGWQRHLSCIARWFLPTYDDLKVIPLPGRLYFLYYILSPFTWFYRTTRNVMKIMSRGL